MLLVNKIYQVLFFTYITLYFSSINETKIKFLSYVKNNNVYYNIYKLFYVNLNLI